MGVLQTTKGATELLSRMFASKKVAHAVALISDNYIDAARSLAASIICKNEQFPPCGECEHCIKAKKNIHPDIIEIAPLKGKVYISVEQIREIRSDAYITPNEARAKVYIINGACLMNEAAQNALLLILEQPPKGVHFVLCDSSVKGLLPTVISRLSVYYLEGERKERSLKYEEKCKALYNAFVNNSEAEFFTELVSFTKREQALEFLLEFCEFLTEEIKKNSKRELVALYDNTIICYNRLQNSGNLSLCLATYSANCREDN